DLRRPADELAIALERDPLLQVDQPVESLLDDGLRHLLVEAGRRCAGARRVLEREGGVEASTLGYLERAFEVLLGLAGEPDDDVARDRDAGDRRPDPVEPPEVAFGPVGASHRTQRAVRPRLQREVDMLADAAAFRH